MTCYFNTKLGPRDTFDGPDRLAQFENKTFPSVFLRQSTGLTSLRLNTDWESLLGCDYLKVSNGTDSRFYHVTDVPIVDNDGAIVVPLEYDPLLSKGGISALADIAGWAVRAHAESDKLFENIIPEDWANTAPLKIRNYSRFGLKSEGQYEYSVVLATCDLSRVKDYAANIQKVSEATGEGDLSVVWPATPYAPVINTAGDITRGTKFTMTRELADGTEESYSYTIPGVYAFDLTDPAIIEAVNYVQGIEHGSAIIGMYNIPAVDALMAPSPGIGVEGSTEPVLKGAYLEITGRYLYQAPSMPYEYATVKNKKVFSLFNRYKLVSLTSGATSEFEAYQIYNNDKSPAFKGAVDPGMNGTVYMGPGTYMGQTCKLLEHCVGGLEWVTSGFTYTMGRGALLSLYGAGRDIDRASAELKFDSAAANDRMLQTSVNNMASLISSVPSTSGYRSAFGQFMNAPLSDDSAFMSAYGNLRSAERGLMSGGMSAAGGIASAGFNQIMAQRAYDRDAAQRRHRFNRSIGESNFNAARDALGAAPTLAFPVAPNASNFFGNGFGLMQTTLADSDVKKLDDWFSSMGYAVDEPFKMSMLSSRKNHNYIQTTGAVVTCPGAARWELDAIGAMLDSGVRIWHTTPSRESLYDNPIK